VVLSKMKHMLENFLNRRWYPANKDFTQFAWRLCTWPLSATYYLGSRYQRQQAIRAKATTTHAINTPIVIVGNIHVGGMGKSPIVTGLALQWQSMGFKVGILLRGYGASAGVHTPCIVDDTKSAAEVGDEAKMHSLLTQSTVVVSRDRQAGALFLAQLQVDIILCDDGLQHYKLARDYEIAVVDAHKGFGNRQLLPSGPLRETIQRLAQVDLVLSQSSQAQPQLDSVDTPNALQKDHLQLQAVSNKCIEYTTKYLDPYHLLSQSTVTFEQLRYNLTPPITAIAGIAQPEKFFTNLKTMGLQVNTRAYPDHYVYSIQDLRQDDSLLMTLKDGVKCLEFAQPNWYALPYTAHIEPSLAESIYETAVKNCAQRQIAS